MYKLPLKTWRQKTGLTQEQLAQKIKRSVSTIKKWENGTTYPKQPDIEVLCKIFGCTYDLIDFLPSK
jgi:transcriptional regulator with XRE-family HTH domain